MKTLNPRNETSFTLKSVRELTLEEVEHISGGAVIDDFTHGKGCPCMTCRIQKDKLQDN